MKFWKWLINRYVSKIKGIQFTPKWGLWSYYVGSVGAFFSGVIGFFIFFFDVRWGLIFTGVTLVFAILGHYGWYLEKVQTSTGNV